LLRPPGKIGPCRLWLVYCCSPAAASCQRPRTPVCCRPNGICASLNCSSAAISRAASRLTDAEWAEFAGQTIAPNFPDGFTAYDGEGQWRNPQTGQIAGGPTKILLVAAKPEPDLSRRLSAVIEAYKAQFHQQSVGIITRDSCAAF
jgi:Protein of unknown function (DUF3574)